ncbi:MAG TPA: hypothetical protein VHF69_04715, partial [Candidatus Synoicihabitans sp.]|nr:hypothetical protein [Candidatus Synoicihabitans sp.]
MTTLHPFSVTEPRPVQVEALLSAYERQIQRRSNRLFELLLGGQWIFAIAVAAMWSPRAWTGTVATVHP